MKRHVTSSLWFLGFVALAACSAEDVTSAHRSARSAAPEVSVAPGRAAPSTPATSASPLAPRDIVRDATIHLRARRPQVVVDAARRWIEARGGFVDASNTVGTGALVSSHATFRVATGQYADALHHLRGLGDVLEVSERGEDVTAQRADADARLVAKRQLEARLLALTNHVGSVAELIQVENELGRVRADIESMEATQRGLEGRIAYATIRLDVDAPDRPMVASAESPTSTFRNAARQGHRFAIGTLAATIALITATSPFWTACAIVWLLRRWSSRRLAHV